MKFREFSNKQQHGKSVLGILFELSPAEMEIYRHLVESDGKTAKEIGDFVGKDRSTAYRMLQHLCSAGIVDKITKYLPKGGYYHIYDAKDPALLVDELKVNIRESYEKILDLVEKAEKSEDMLPALTSVLSEGTSFGTGQANAAGERGKKKKRARTGRVRSADRKDKGVGTGSEPGRSGEGVRDEEQDGDEEGEEDEDHQIPIHLR